MYKTDVFLKKKNWSTYREVCNVILKECENQEFFRDPQIINLYFVQAINAVQCVIGEQKSEYNMKYNIFCGMTVYKVVFNFCHSSQNTYRKIQEVGLQIKYIKWMIH